MDAIVASVHHRELELALRDARPCVSQALPTPYGLMEATRMAAVEEVKVTDIYREQYSHFRSMNDILYKIPPLFTLAIGGLWYFAVSQMPKDRIISVGVFVLAAILCLCFENIMWRFGAAFSAYIANLNRLDGNYAVTITGTRRPSTVKTVRYLLWLCALVSILGATYACVS